MKREIVFRAIAEPGDMVQYMYHGKEYHGTVNQVNGVVGRGFAIVKYEIITRVGLGTTYHTIVERDILQVIRNH